MFLQRSQLTHLFGRSGPVAVRLSDGENQPNELVGVDPDAARQVVLLARTAQAG
jgi:hypothetical protein